MVNKDITAGIGDYKAETFFVVEPLYCSLRHVSNSPPLRFYLLSQSASAFVPPMAELRRIVCRSQTTANKKTTQSFA